MSYQTKIVLHCPNGRPADLEGLVKDFKAAGVIYVGVVGKDCSQIEDAIDELCVDLGDDPYDLLTASHPNETLEQAVELAESLSLEYEGPVQVVAR